MIESLRRRLAPPIFPDQEQTRRVVLLHTVSLAGALIVVAIAVAAIVLGQPITPFLLAYLALVLLPAAAVQVTMRRGRINAASIIFILGFWLAITTAMLFNGGIVAPIFALHLITILLAGLLMGRRAALVVTILSVGAGLVAFLAARDGLLPPARVTLGPFQVFLIMVGAFVTTALLQNLANRAIAEALNIVSESNRELQLTKQLLEKRVADRTRDLMLAAEVGRSVSQIRDLDELLIEAVELIGERFKLYYTQVYLVDTAANVLLLRAGTGTVGAELVQLRHRLPIGTGSVNGIAASEKRPVIVPDTRRSTIFRPNALLPETRSEMAVPLRVAERVVGVLNLQANESGALTAENLPAFEALAGQLAVTVENARLFSEIAQARQVVEIQTRRLTRELWQDYLNAIDRDEEVAGAYQLSDSPTLGTRPSLDQVAVPISLAGEQIGRIEVGIAPERLNPEQEQLLEAVSRQVAQQVENLRLLAEAERYRHEAEQAARRLTVDGWRNYVAGDSPSSEPIIGYRYDGRQVEPLAQEGHFGDGIRELLSVRDAVIGEIVVAPGENADPAIADVVAAVAERLGNHVENLRLSEQTAVALADVQRRNEELAIVNRVVSMVTTTFDLRQSLQFVAEELATVVDVDQIAIGLLDDDQSGLTIVAEHTRGDVPVTALGTTISLQGNSLLQKVLSTRETVIDDSAHTTALTGPLPEHAGRREAQKLVVIPMFAADEVIGTVEFRIMSRADAVQPEQLRLAQTIVFQAAAAIQNSRLFNQLQSVLADTALQAERLAQLNEMSEQLNRAIDLDEIYRIAAMKTARIFATDRVTLALLDEAGDSAQVIALEGDRGSVPIGRPQRIEGSITERVVKERRVIRLHDDEPAPDREINSALVAPLITGRGVIGTINVGSKAFDQFSGQDESLVLQLASLLSSAIETSRLFARTQQALAEAQTLYSVSTQLNAATSLQETLLAVIDPTVASGASRAGLWLFELNASGQPEWQVLSGVWSRDGDFTIEPGSRLELNQFPLSQLWLANPQDVLVIEDTRDDERVDRRSAALLEQVGGRATVFMPLTLGRRWIGVIHVHWPERRKFAPADRRLYRSMAAQAAAVIDSRLLLQETQIRAGQLETLAEIEVALSQANSVDDIVRALVPAALSPDCIALQYIDADDSDRPTVARVIRMLENGEMIAPTDEPGRVIAEIPGSERWLAEPFKPLLLEGSDSSLAVLPLRSGGRWQGLINFAWDKPHTFEASESFLFQQLLEPVGAVVASRRALAETEALYRASAELNSAQSYRDLLTVFRRYGLVHLQPRNVTVNFFDRPWTDEQLPKLLEVPQRQSDPDESHGVRRYALEGYPSFRGLHNRDRLTYIEDVATDERLGDALRHLYKERFGAHTVVLIPLVAAGEWIGFIDVIFGERVSLADLNSRRIESVAAQLSVAAQNLRSLETTNRLLASEQRQRRVADSLVEASRRLARSLSEDELRAAVIDEIYQLLQPDQINLFEWDPEHNAFTLERQLLAVAGEREDGRHAGDIVRPLERPDLAASFSNNRPDLVQKDVVGGLLREQYLLPWLVGPEVAGIIEVFHTAAGATIRPEDQLQCAGIVNQAAIALQNARLFAREQVRAEQLRRLAAVETALSRAQTEAEIVTALVDLIPDGSEAPAISLIYAESDADDWPSQIDLVTVWANGQIVPEAASEIFIEREHLPHILDWDAQAAEVLFFEDITRDERVNSYLRALGEARNIRGLAILPLVSAGRWQGAVTLAWAEPHRFESAERFIMRQLLEALAAVVASRRANLAQQAARRETELLYLASRRINEAAGNLQEIVAAVAEADFVPGIDRATLLLFEVGGAGETAVRLAGNWYDGQGEAPAALGSPLPAPGPDSLLRGRVASFIDDFAAAASDEGSLTAILAAAPAGAVVVLPLWTGGHQQGVMVLSAPVTHRFTERDRQLYESLVPQLAVAIENRQLLEAARARARREQLLREITAQVRGATDVESIMRTAVRQVGQALGRPALAFIEGEKSLTATRKGNGQAKGTNGDSSLEHKE